MLWGAIALVVCALLAAKVWLYRWVKFKMDEGAITQFLHSDAAAAHGHSSDAIAAATHIAVARVRLVCQQSKIIGGAEPQWRRL